MDTEGGLHHVIVRGLNRQTIIRGDVDREDLVRRLGSIVPGEGAQIYAWALLSNHFHLLIRTGRHPLSRVMRRLLTGYSVAFNLRHGRSGHLLQNRYKSILVEEESCLLELVRYLHLNPLRAGLVAGIEELDTYPWCGHSALLGQVKRDWQDVDFVLEQFGPRVGSARREYWKFVAAGVARGARDDLVGGGLMRSAGGWAQVHNLRRGRELWAYDERILGSGAFVEAIWREMQSVSRPPPAQRVGEEGVHHLVAGVAARLGLTAQEVLGGSRRKPVVAARYVVSYLAVHEHGLAPTVVANYRGVSRQSVLRGTDCGPVVMRNHGLRPDELLP